MPSSPLAIAASQGQKGSAFRNALTTGTSTAPAPSSFAPAARLDRIEQIARVGSVHAKDTALDTLHGTQVGLVREHVAKLNQPIELVEKLCRFHLANLLDQHLPESWRAAQAHCFQECDLAATQINLTPHKYLSTMNDNCRAAH